MKARRAAEATGDAPGRNGAPTDGWIRTMRTARGVSLRQRAQSSASRATACTSPNGGKSRAASRCTSFGASRRRWSATCSTRSCHARRQGRAPSQKYATQLRAREDADERAVLESSVEPVGTPVDGVRARLEK